MGQSSNDVFPSAVHLAALDVGPERAAARAQAARALASRSKASSFKNVVKAGRTHLMDAVPVTLGQEFARLRRPDGARLRSGSQSALVHVGQIPLGGTATGTGLNTHPRFAEKVRARLRANRACKQIAAPLGPLRGAGQPRRAGRALRRAEGARRVAHQDRRRPRADGLRAARRASARSSCPSCRRAPRSCPARSTR